MKKILVTGGTGFLGRNLVAKLKNYGFDIYAPRRLELDLRNTSDVEAYVRKYKFEVVIHMAIPNLLPGSTDKRCNLFKDSMLIFMNLFRLRDEYEKMIYFGSGAEFNKKKPIVSVREEDFGYSMPTDDYGLAKYLMNEMCRKSENVYNLRIFGCYGPTDAPFKLITNAIEKCFEGQDIVLHQDCYFDYIYVDDIGPALLYFVNNTPQFHDYNLCSGERYRIYDICNIVRKQMQANVAIRIDEEGMNNEYTGDNSRLLKETKIHLTSIEEGIRKQIAIQKGVDLSEKTGS